MILGTSLNEGDLVQLFRTESLEAVGGAITAATSAKFSLNPGCYIQNPEPGTLSPNQ